MAESKAPPDVADLVRRLRDLSLEFRLSAENTLTDEQYAKERADAQTCFDAADALDARARHNETDNARPNGASETETGRRSHSLTPTIICLCGSTRFIETFAVKTWELELEGFIVLGCTLLPSWYCPVRDHFAENQGVKPQRDAHHLQKIDLADEVLVLNVGGYIGESTRNEIAYAMSHGKTVNYLEPLPSPPSETLDEK